MSEDVPTAPLLPWHHDPWQRLMAQLAAERWPHALLIQGLPGLGKAQFAQRLAQALLCTASYSDRPCGGCKACRLWSSGNHPDTVTLSPEGNSQQIKIAQVRDVVDFLSRTAQQGGRKCVVINPAEAMNVSTTNALLKSLEEPQGDSVFILVSAYPSQLLATLRSRCQKRVITPPSTEQALAWLQPQVGDEAETLLARAHGAPLAALAAFRDDLVAREEQLIAALGQCLQGRQVVSQTARSFAELDNRVGVDLLLRWVEQATAHQLAQRPLAEEFQALAVSQPALPTTALFRYRDRLLEAKAMLLSTANANVPLVWEELLLDWLQLHRQSRKRAVGHP